MTTPARLKLAIYQGATFRKRFTWKTAEGALIDLTGCTARMQVRAEVESPTVLMSLTTENGGITLGGTTGVIDLYASALETSAISWFGGVWDLEIVHPNGDVTRLLQGRIVISPEVTR